MNKAQVLYKFFSSFGLTAYTSYSVPEDAVYPYLTYETVFGSLLDGELNITANLWYRTDSESIPNAKAQEIANEVGMGGKYIPYDGGALWIKRGTPWCNCLTDAGDSKVKRRLLNFDIEFISQD
jgi:hypothetical protein